MYWSTLSTSTHRKRHWKSGRNLLTLSLYLDIKAIATGCQKLCPAENGEWPKLLAPAPVNEIPTIFLSSFQIEIEDKFGSLKITKRHKCLSKAELLHVNHFTALPQRISVSRWLLIGFSFLFGEKIFVSEKIIYLFLFCSPEKNCLSWRGWKSEARWGGYSWQLETRWFISSL